MVSARVHEAISMDSLRAAIGASFSASAAKKNYDAAALAQAATRV